MPNMISLGLCMRCHPHLSWTCIVIISHSFDSEVPVWTATLELPYISISYFLVAMIGNTMTKATYIKRSVFWLMVLEGKSPSWREGGAWQLEELTGKNNPGSRARLSNLKTLASDTLSPAMQHHPTLPKQHLDWEPSAQISEPMRDISNSIHHTHLFLLIKKKLKLIRNANVLFYLLLF